jgi:hypothetical protein
MQATDSNSDLENAPGEIRTHGPRIRNPVLYPPELRGHNEDQLATLYFFSCVSICAKLGLNMHRLSC